MISILESYPEVAKEWHPTKNGDLTPDKVSAGMTKRVWWLCPNTCPEGCPHEWPAYLSNRCKGQYGCPFCSHLTKKVCIHTSIVGTHPEVAAQWHPTKNGDKKPEDFSFGSEKKVWWLCPKTCPEGCLHEWEAELNKRIIRGADAGCPFCATSHRRVCIHDSIVTKAPDLAAQWHPTKNGDIKPESISINSSQNLWWLCPNSCEFGCLHEWQARPSDRTRKETGCPKCSTFRSKICPHQSIAFEFPEIACEWHPTKNGSLLPTSFSKGSDKRIWWKCTKNSSHEWATAINNRCSNGMSECPYCKNKTEEQMYNVLCKIYSNIKRQFKIQSCKRIKFLPFDICIPSHNVIIEIDGAQHFRKITNWLDPEKTLLRDVFKMKKAEKEGFRVIRIDLDTIYKKDNEWMYLFVKENLCELIESDEINHTFISNNITLYDKHIELYESDEIIDILTA